MKTLLAPFAWLMVCFIAGCQTIFTNKSRAQIREEAGQIWRNYLNTKS